MLKDLFRLTFWNDIMAIMENPKHRITEKLSNYEYCNFLQKKSIYVLGCCKTIYETLIKPDDSFFFLLSTKRLSFLCLCRPFMTFLLRFIAGKLNFVKLTITTNLVVVKNACRIFKNNLLQNYISNNYLP